jgi:two-component system sensor histidine kinase KdpD
MLGAILGFYRLFANVSPTTVALTYLLVILLLAANWGLRFAIVASIAASLGFNFFFLPPIGTFTIAGTQNWVALLVFLATALIASNLSNRIKEEAEASNRRRRELELLYDFGQRLLLTESEAELLKSIPQSIVTAFRTAGAALYLSEGERVYLSNPKDMQVSLDELREAVHSRASQPIASADGNSSPHALLPLTVGVRPIGSVMVEGNLPSLETLEAMGSLVALSIQRAGAVDKLARADAANESERLRAALLDSVTHDLRTPLTSIKASVTSLLSHSEGKEPPDGTAVASADESPGGVLTPAQRLELLTVIDEESDRLNNLIAQAIEMASLDAHEVQLEIAPHPVQQVVSSALENSADLLQGRVVEVRMPDSLPRVNIDPVWIEKVLVHLLENAVKYSPAEESIFISAEHEGGNLIVSVADRGIGIDATEQSMIFDKFYRGQSQRYRVAGTGMGLAISKAIVESHGGTISVTSQSGSGSVFSFTLPVVS